MSQLYSENQQYFLYQKQKLTDLKTAWTLQLGKIILNFYHCT